MKTDRKVLLSTIREMKAKGFSYLVNITAVDYVKSLQVLYFIRNIEENKDEIIEVDLDPFDAWVPTVIDVHPSADWYEREMYEMFGIDIRERRVSRLLLEKWDGKNPPLRKSFVWGAPYESSD